MLSHYEWKLGFHLIYLKFPGLHNLDDIFKLLVTKEENVPKMFVQTLRNIINRYFTGVDNLSCS